MVQIKDIDGLKKDEIQILTGQKHYNQLHETSNKQPDIWLNFYDRLKDIKVFALIYPRTITKGTFRLKLVPMRRMISVIYWKTFSSLLSKSVNTVSGIIADFSGEEG